MQLTAQRINDALNAATRCDPVQSNHLESIPTVRRPLDASDAAEPRFPRNEKTIQRRCSSAGPAQRASTDTDDPSRQLHMLLIKHHGPSINPFVARAAEIHRRLSSSHFGPALEQFLSSDQGLSASTITRLTTQWQDEARAFNARPLAGTDYVYVWVDGIHLKVRLEADKVCLMVVIGVRADGRKELVCLADGYRESADSWADLLRDAKRCGMAAPVLAVGDGALGFWKAVRDVFP